MIVVVARATTTEEQRDELIRVSQAVAQASRAEAGCIGYRVYEDTEQRNSFVFVEEWADPAALREHFTTPHIAAFMAAVPGVVTAPPDIQFHEIATTLTLADVRAGA